MRHQCTLISTSARKAYLLRYKYSIINYIPILQIFYMHIQIFCRGQWVLEHPTHYTWVRPLCLILLFWPTICNIRTISLTLSSFLFLYMLKSSCISLIPCVVDSSCKSNIKDNINGLFVCSLLS